MKWHSADWTRRERRLWAMTAAVVVAIYSTLGLTGALADEIVARDLMAATFMLGMVMIAAAVVAFAFKTRAGREELGILLATSAVYIMILQRMTSPVERSHLFEYSAVALLVYEALTERFAKGGRRSRAAILAVAVAIAIGTVDELVQLVLPNRVFDPIDIMFNSWAAVTAVVARSVLNVAQRRRLAR